MIAQLLQCAQSSFYFDKSVAGQVRESVVVVVAGNQVQRDLKLAGRAGS